jgi:hypothetical protein
MWRHQAEYERIIACAYDEVMAKLYRRALAPRSEA